MIDSTALQKLTENGVDLPSLVIDRVQKALVHSIHHPITDELNAEILKKLSSYVAVTRWYLINDEKAATIQWQKLAQDVDMVDMIVSLTGRTIFQLQGLGLYELTAQWLSRSIGLLATSPTINKELTDKIGTEAKLAALYTANPWLMTIILLEHSGALAMLMRKVNLRA